MRGIYIHIPLCLRKCPYCDFYSVRYDDALAEKYVDALIRNFKSGRYKGLCADTVYIGGGTPSSLDEKLLDRLLRGVFDNFKIDKNAEITIEANPCSVSEDKLRAYLASGIGRVSFGIQSADDRELALLGRLHDYDTAEKAVLAAHRAGFDNISGDIMAGTPGQDRESLLKSIDRLCSLPLKHISAYMLSIESGTPFDNDDIRAQTADDDKMSELYLAMAQRLEEKGFCQYEISNFSQKGFESRHNLKYWLGEEYIGFGASAHSLYAGERYSVPPDIGRYITDPLQSEDPEPLPYDEKQEYIMLHLRVKSGISISRICKLYGNAAADSVYAKAQVFEKNGLCVINGDSISLTASGCLVSNGIITQLQYECDRHNS